MRPKKIIAPLKERPFSQKKRIGNIILSSMNLHANESQEFTFSLATTSTQVHQSFQLLYQSYVEEGFIKKNNHHFHLTKYHLLPTTSVLVVQRGKEVVATVSIIKNSTFGIPAAAVSHPEECFASNSRYCEISSFAVKPEYRQRESEILLPFIKYFLFYARHYLCVDNAVIAVHPRHFRFYELIIGFTPITTTAESGYAFVNGAEVQCGTIDLKTFPEQIRKMYSENDAMQDLFGYYSSPFSKNFLFPERNYHIAFDVLWTPSIMRTLWQELACPLPDLIEHERTIIERIYRADAYRNILGPLPPVTKMWENRKNVRIDVAFMARIFLNEKQFIDARIENASYSGIGLQDDRLKFGREYRLLIALGPFKLITVRAQVTRKKEDGQCGLSIIQGHALWQQHLAQVLNPLQMTSLATRTAA